VTVNPYDIEACADGIQRALSMPPEERRARMRSLRRGVIEHNVYAWADGFLQQLRTLPAVEQNASAGRPGGSLSGTLAEVRQHKGLRLLLDYDGTLVPLARSPELAAPDDELLTLLEQLTDVPGIQLDIVSGRPHETLERWFGDLPITLWAEHGFWHRRSTGGVWEAAVTVPPDWMKRVEPILEQFASRTPGAHVEIKTASLAWHYRESPRDFGIRQAHELRLLLGDLLSNQPLEVLEGKKVIEVRLRGVSKRVVAQRVAAETGSGTMIVAIGDDQTDEELFRALPSSSLTVAVGRTWSAAAFRLDDHRAVRRILRLLVPDQSVVDERSAGAYPYHAVSA
jgi:trehalose 6-phosphate synthase/phosphatase